MYVCMSSRFFENQPYAICSHFSEKASKGTFLKPEKLQNHSNKGKEKEKKKEQGEGKEEKKKSNGCTLSFYNGYFGDSFCLKITVGGKKVYLAIMLSKIQLHAYVCVYMLYVYHHICLNFKYGLQNRGSFVCSQSSQKENKGTLGTQIKCDVENFKPGRNPFSCRKPHFCKRRV